VSAAEDALLPSDVDGDAGALGAALLPSGFDCAAGAFGPESVAVLTVGCGGTLAFF